MLANGAQRHRRLPPHRRALRVQTRQNTLEQRLIILCKGTSKGKSTLYSAYNDVMIAHKITSIVPCVAYGISTGPIRSKNDVRAACRTPVSSSRGHKLRKTFWNSKTYAFE